MVWSTAVFVLIALLTHRVVPASIDYEPIQITVNENFNSQSGSGTPLPARSGILHQGANFYFKPQINIPPDHIEALTALVQQDLIPNRVTETEKLIEILKSLPKISGAKVEQREDILKLLSSLTVPAAIKDEILLLMQKIVPVVEEVKSEEPIILEEVTGVISPNPAVIIPEAPTLPPMVIEEIVPVVEESKLDKPVILEESVGVLSPIAEIEVLVSEEPNLSIEEEIMPTVEEFELIQPVLVEESVGMLSSTAENIPEAPTLPPLLVEEVVPVVEDVEVLEPVILKETVSVASPNTNIDNVIPEAPTLPPSSIEDVVPVVEEVEVLEPVILEEAVGVLSPSTNIGDVIPEAPTLPPPSMEDIVPVLEDVEILEPVILEETVGVMPETPTLPPALNEDIVSVVEDVEMMEPIILEETVGVIPETPTIPAIEELMPCEEVELVEPVMLEERPADEWSLITEIDEIILEPSTLPPQSIEEIELVEPIALVETVGALSAATEIKEIVPNAPTLPPLPIEDIVPTVEEVELVKPEILEETVIFETPTLPAIEELLPAYEEVELVESVILEESEDVLSPITEIEQIIPDAPTLSPISIESVDLFIKDVLLKQPDILEELIKIFPEIDGDITEVSTLTPLSIEEVDSNDTIVLEEYADVLASDPKVDIIVPETIILDEHLPVEEEIVIDPCIGLKEPAYYMSKTSEPLIIPGPPKLSFSGAPCALVENTKIEFMDSHEPTIITEPVLESDKAVYFISEQFPVINGEEVNEDVIMVDATEMLPDEEQTELKFNKEPNAANSSALDEVSRGNSYQNMEQQSNIPMPANNQEVFNYGPIISQLSIPKAESSIVPKVKSLKSKLVKGRPYRFRTNPYPNLSLKKHSTSYPAPELEKPFTNLV
uniref:SFRICE_011717 n=1 Tax=Spodoptera frugiperda TaxID=7108 RepID=A0A2H1VDW3_SPOFR